MKLTLVVKLDSIHTGVVAEQREDTACLLTIVFYVSLRRRTEGRVPKIPLPPSRLLGDEVVFRIGLLIFFLSSLSKPCSDRAPASQDF
jgi:hypothetical protein